MANHAVSRAEARNLIVEIAEERGVVEEELWEEVPLNVRQRLQAAFLRKDKIISEALVQLSQNLYSNSARFVFELLQNADDNLYTKARQLGQMPYVSFSVSNEKVVLECNEDGFMPSNIHAICSVGQSSKVGQQGYIGNKGIGFKSVFKVAWKVYIQSGNFSFYFQHRKGDPGLNMITPIWVNSNENLETPLTRMTLYLHPVGDDDDAILRTQRQFMFKQFQELQENMLLFMNNIERIKVSISQDGKGSYSATYSRESGSSGLVTLHRDILRNGTAERETAYFHIIKHLATGLSKHESRSYSKKNLASKEYSKAEVVLAFPVTHESVPMIKNQSLYAFLPLKEFFFSFLIHTDFETQANREDINNSARNIQLLDSIATAFVNAVHHFNQHPTLRYQWMRYLPDRYGVHWGSLWAELVDLIAEKLSKASVLYGATESFRVASNKSLRSIEDLRYLRADALDRHGRPLVPDIEPRLYPSAAYLKRDLELLKNYGLDTFTLEEFLLRVESDLESKGSQVCKMKSPFTEDDWHSRTARLLSLSFEKSMVQNMQFIRGLALLPLIERKWASLKHNDSPVYYPKTHGITIPADIGLRLIDPSSVKNSDRKALFNNIGVQIADVHTVRSAILRKYWTRLGPFGAMISDGPRNVAASKSHLQFLYLTNHLCDPKEDLGVLTIIAQDGTRRQPCKESIVIPESSRYGARELFYRTSEAPGLIIPFLHEDYLKFQPQKPEESQITWHSWLVKCLKVQPRLTIIEQHPLGASGPQLSSTCQYLAKYRRDKLLGFLRSHWKFERKNLRASPELLCTLRAIELADTQQLDMSLGACYLPITTTKKLVEMYLLPDEDFPWIPLDSEEEVIPSEWKEMMDDLEAGFLHDEVDFWLCILDCIVYGTYGPTGALPATGLPKADRIYKLYEHLEYLVRRSENPKTSTEKICKYFANHAAIYIPGSEIKPATWADIDDCLWLAPSHLHCRYPLASLYDMDRHMESDHLMYLEKLFKSIIGVSDACQDTFIEELEYIRDHGKENFNNIQDLYQELNKIRNRESRYDGVVGPSLSLRTRRVRRTQTQSVNKSIDLFIVPGCPSSDLVPFTPLIGKELPGTNEVFQYQHISLQHGFENWSAEEIRLSDYSQRWPHSNKPSPRISASSSSPADSTPTSNRNFGRGTSLGLSSDAGTSLVAGSLTSQSPLSSPSRGISDDQSSRPDALKNAFRTKNLIYVSEDPGGNWYNASNCLWSLATQISGRVSLNVNYPELEDFFVGFLGIQTLNLQMVFNELKKKAKKGAPIESIKKSLLCLNSFLKTERALPDFDDISKSKIFPIILRSGKQQLVASSADFTLVDRQPLRDLFPNASYLDFNLDETRHLEPLVNWAGLQERYLSASVTEHSSIDGSVVTPLSNTTRNISRKAFGLLRIAVHFDSPRARRNEKDFYEVLRGIRVFQADKISSELHLRQGKEAIVAVRPAGELHIDSSGSSPNIYVLCDKKSQRRCYLSLLPRRLLEWILTDPVTEACEPITDKSVMAVKTILMASRSDITQILDEEGIVNVKRQDIDNESDDDESNDSGGDELQQRYEVRKSQGSEAKSADLPRTVDAEITQVLPALMDRETRETTSSRIPPLSGPENVAGSTSAGRGLSSETIESSSFTASASERAFVPRAGVQLEDESTPKMQYIKLLDKVITIANGFTFPSLGAFNMEAMTAEINDLLNDSSGEESDEDDWRFRSGEQRDRDFRVGAAGELFVFKLLTHHSDHLPGFGPDNWQSRIRKYVTVHPSLVHLGSWNKKETADITYQDVQGTLTNFFIDKGYLNSSSWAGKKPMYFIEVKTTTGPCDMRFFMSRSQYRRMQDYSNGQNGRDNQGTIYVIFRVHDLGQNGMGLRIYMDPEVLRKEGKLAFKEETWSITPSRPSP